MVAGIRSCNLCFSESFALRNRGYRELERGEDNVGGVRFLADLNAVEKRLKQKPAALIVDVDEIIRRVSDAAAAIRQKKEKH